jgi:hypothetical protein
MGKIKAFKFTFQDNKAVFYPGQWVCGQCSLKLDESLKIKGLQISLIGEATVGKRKEVILTPQVQNVFGPSTLAAGGHQQDFRFQLPPIAMPTSFEGKIGSIRYCLEGTLERPWKSNIQTRKVFTVWEYVDCNNPLLSAPQVGQSEKVISGGCMSGNKRLGITVQLDRRGYCPGENIIVSVKTRDFPQDVQAKLLLTMVSVFNEAAQKQGTTRRDVLRTQDIGTTPRGNRAHRFNNVSLQIPSVPPTIRWKGSGGAGISVYYLVELKMAKRRNQKKIFWHVNVPVTMGTIPLSVANNEAPSRAPVQATLSTAGSRESQAIEPPSYSEIMPTAPPLPDNYPVNPPPYEECILGSGLLEVDAATDPDNRYGDASFTPVYTMARGARLDYSFANFEDN